jgi:hypothetical protein
VQRVQADEGARKCPICGAVLEMVVLLGNDFVVVVVVVVMVVLLLHVIYSAAALFLPVSVPCLHLPDLCLPLPVLCLPVPVPEHLACITRLRPICQGPVLPYDMIYLQATCISAQPSCTYRACPPWLPKSRCTSTCTLSPQAACTPRWARLGWALYSL